MNTHHCTINALIAPLRILKTMYLKSITLLHRSELVVICYHKLFDVSTNHEQTIHNLSNIYSPLYLILFLLSSPQEIYNCGKSIELKSYYITNFII